MNEHFVKVLKTDFITHNVKRFMVEKPAGYKFIPGQATEIAINEPNLKKELRPFTFTSVNDSDHLEFIIKIYTGHNGITEKLLKVTAGDELILHKIFGTISYKGPGLFIAGGAGITPFIAIFRQLKLKNKLAGNTLLFANRTADDIILQDELKGMLNGNFINVLEVANGPGTEVGFIGKELLRKYKTANHKYHYICGPEKFTSIIFSHLSDLGVEESKIIFEK